MKTIINSNGKIEGYEVDMKPYNNSAINEVLKEHTNLVNCLEELDNYLMELFEKEILINSLSDIVKSKIANIYEKNDCYKLVRGLSD